MGLSVVDDIVDDNTLLQTFPTCSTASVYGVRGKERIFAKSPYGMHGIWHHSWGLYNTIRAISANNAYVKNVSLQGVFASTDFEYTEGYNAFKAIRSIPDGITSPIQGITGNSNKMSGWYLPSHDEMAFIAANTISVSGFNINSRLLMMEDAEPINGTYWCSTGTFDYSKNEGEQIGVLKPKPGSVAIAFNVDINGVDNFVYKANRKEKYKVRPIRMIRCDSQVPENKYLWLIPTVYESKINQRNIDILNTEIV